MVLLPGTGRSDTDKIVVARYGSLQPNGIASRNTFLIDHEGKIAKVWTGSIPRATARKC